MGISVSEEFPRGRVGRGAARGRAPGPETRSPRSKDQGTARGRRTHPRRGRLLEPSAGRGRKEREKEARAARLRPQCGRFKPPPGAARGGRAGERAAPGKDGEARVSASVSGRARDEGPDRASQIQGSPRAWKP